MTEASAQQQVNQQPSIEEVDHKVFVGNLPFRTKNEELSELFSEAGKVTAASVITRGRFSKGYGFVAFASSEDAQNAVDKLDGREMEGRNISVQIARPKPAKTQEEGAPSKQRSRGAEGTAPARPMRGRFRGSWRGRRRGVPRAPREQTDSQEEQGENGEKEEDKLPAEKKEGVPRRKFRRPRARRGKRGRPQGRPREPTAVSAQQEPSKTTLFVGNLPFSFDDAALKGIFQGYTVKEAHVVLRRSSGRSKGFGFVQLESEEEQQRALEALQGHEVEGRGLVIKVARMDYFEEMNGEKGGEKAEESA
ncbi:uncharacterized protein VTP21DRAFT_11118 [Calcarisporiella thermophila]|uniref:uncharacterized protein n=1 Tax=Calcarisporiella thermophila TaxID=911321 RepID=UPI0037421F39